MQQGLELRRALQAMAATLQVLSGAKNLSKRSAPRQGAER